MRRSSTHPPCSSGVGDGRPEANRMGVARSSARLLRRRGCRRPARPCVGALGWRSRGTRFSALQQITPGNVGSLVRAWEFHTGDLARRDPKTMASTKFEATPLFVEGRLILCTPFNEVIALDPGAGSEMWRFDPKISIERPANRY